MSVQVTSVSTAVLIINGHATGWMGTHCFVAHVSSQFVFSDDGRVWLYWGDSIVVGVHGVG